MTTLRIRNPLWRPLLPVAVCLTDAGLTLLGQPDSYWQGDYLSVIEGNPLPRWLLEFHPLAFVLVLAGWVLCFSLLILLLPRRWACCAYLAVLFGHSVGAASWLLRLETYGLWWLTAFLMVVVAVDEVQSRRLREASIPGA